MKKSYCRVCSSHCGVELRVEGNAITAMRGDRDNPLTHGYFCIKGRNAIDWHNGHDRLTTSLSRTSEGRHIAISADHALDQIHARLRSIIDAYGPGAVAIYHGTGIFQNVIGFQALRDWVHLIGTPYIYSSMTVDQSAKWVRIGRMGLFETGKYNSLDADVLMIVGNNPAVSHFGYGLVLNNPAAWLREGQRRGMSLIVVDPRRSETAQTADLHLPIKPGTDAVLFAGMIRYILDRNWNDAAFCNRFTTSLEELRCSVEPFTLDRVAERTGLDQDAIERVIERFVGANRKSVITGTGANMGPDSNITEHLAEALNAICGGYRKAGDAIFNTGLFFGLAARRERVLPPDRSWERGPKCHSADIGPLMHEYPTGLLADEIAGPQRDRIRALVVVGGNPAMSGGRALGAALGKLDLLVTVDSRITETTRRSDYVIATELMYERPDCTAFYDAVSAHTYGRVTEAVLRAPEGVISDFGVFWGLARRMGRPLTIRPPTFGAPYDGRGTAGFVCDQVTEPNPADIVRWMASHGRCSYDALVASEHGVLIEDDVPPIEAATVDDGSRLELCPPDVAREIKTLAQAQSTDDERPYLLTVRRMLGAMNSAFSELPATRLLHPTNPAFIHPDDLRIEELRDGDLVRIASASGSVIARVKGDRSLRRGTVAMTHCWGRVEQDDDPLGEEGAFTGRLVDTLDRQAINFMPTQTAIPVSVEALTTASPTRAKSG